MILEMLMVFYYNLDLLFKMRSQSEENCQIYKIELVDKYLNRIGQIKYMKRTKRNTFLLLKS